MSLHADAASAPGARRHEGPLRPDEIRQFEERGFLILRRFFDAEAVGHLSRWLDALQAGDTGGDDDYYPYYEESVLDGRPTLVRIENLCHDPALPECRLLLGEEVLAVARALLGEEPLLFKDKANYKLPGGRGDKLHQDQAAGWNAYGRNFLTLCVCIDENREENAAISILSSGNYRKELMGPEWQPLREDDPPWEPAEEYTLFEADPGDVVLFDAYVPHGSPPNRSSRPRRNIFLTFNGASDGDQRARYYADKLKSYPPNPDGRRERGGYRV